MARVIGNEHLQMIVRDIWSKVLAPKIFKLCEREKESNARVCHQLEHFSICDEGSLQLDVQVTYSFIAGIAAICLLAYLLPDKIRPNHEKLIHIVSVSPKQFTQCNY